MNQIFAKAVFERMELAIENIYAVFETLDWENPELYALWLAQSYKYVQWTTRQLALASAMTKPEQQDLLHWRFIEEAKEEKRHEVIAMNDLKAMGLTPEQFPEFPHTSFFYQTLTYMIERENPLAILGYSLTLEGFAARKGKLIYVRIKNTYDPSCTHFLKLHCEVDVEHFNNALPHLEKCSHEDLPVVLRGIELCESIYCGILHDIQAFIKAKAG